MNEVDIDPFQEIPKDDISPLLELLKSDFPRAVHVYSFINVLAKWKDSDSTYPIQFLAPRGDFRTGAIFFYIIFNKRLDGSIYAWSDEGHSSLVNALQNTKRIQWANYKIMLTCMPEDTWSTVEPKMKEIWKKDGVKFRTSLDKVFWLPREQAEKIVVKIPEDTYITSLKLKDAHAVNNHWPYKHSESLKLISSTIELNFGLGLFTKGKDELVAWSLHWFYGGIGGVHTMIEHRRKGFGAAIVQAITKQMGDLGIDVHLNVIKGNSIGEHFFANLGFLHAYNGLWAYSEIDD